MKGEIVTEESMDIEELGVLAVNTLKAFFEDVEPDKMDVIRAKIAASVWSSAVRYRQAQGAREALGWGMATTLLDKDQLRNYIRVSMPGSPLVKALPEGKG